jgi:hypothetical protein
MHEGLASPSVAAVNRPLPRTSANVRLLGGHSLGLGRAELGDLEWKSTHVSPGALACAQPTPPTHAHHRTLLDAAATSCGGHASRREHRNRKHDARLARVAACWPLPPAASPETQQRHQWWRGWRRARRWRAACCMAGSLRQFPVCSSAGGTHVSTAFPAHPASNADLDAAHGADGADAHDVRRTWRNRRPSGSVWRSMVSNPHNAGGTTR